MRLVHAGGVLLLSEHLFETSAGRPIIEHMAGIE